MPCYCCLCGNKASSKSRRFLCDGHLALLRHADLSVEERVAEMPLYEPPKRVSTDAEARPSFTTER